MREKKIIWFAIVMSTFIYAFILYWLARRWPHPGSFDAAMRNTTVLALYFVAIMTFVLAFVIPRFVSVPKSAFVVSLALFEACAIYGLLGAFLTQDWRVFVPGWALALIGFVTRWPSEDAATSRI